MLYMLKKKMISRGITNSMIIMVLLVVYVLEHVKLWISWENCNGKMEKTKLRFHISFWEG